MKEPQQWICFSFWRIIVWIVHWRASVTSPMQGKLAKMQIQIRNEFALLFLSDFITPSASFGCRALHFLRTDRIIWYENRWTISMKAALVWWQRVCSQTIKHISHPLAFVKLDTRKRYTIAWSTSWTGEGPIRYANSEISLRFNELTHDCLNV